MVRLVALLSGLLAGLVLPQSGGGAAAGSVVIAVAIALFLRGTVAVTILLVGAAIVAGVATWIDVFDVAVGLAGGVLLGCAAILAHSPDDRRSQLLVVGSFFAGLLTAGLIEALQSPMVPARYADYLVQSERSAPVVVPVLALLTVIAAGWSMRTPATDGPPLTRDIRTVAAVLLVPLSGFVVQAVLKERMFGDSVYPGTNVYWGILVVPFLLVAAALLPGRGGTMVLAGTATAATSSVLPFFGLDLSAPRWTFALVLLTVAAIAIGVLLGRKWRRPVIGMAVLALVAATSLFDEPPLDNVAFAAGLVVFPVAVAFTFAACGRQSPPAFAAGLAVPVAATLPVVATYGWTAYTPLTEIDTSTFSPGVDLWLSAGGAVLTVALAGIGMVLLQRRAG